MPTIKRYISNDGVEHGSVPEMRDHEAKSDTATAASVTAEMISHWLSGGVQAPEVRDALLRVAVRIGRARPADQKRFRSAKAANASTGVPGAGPAVTDAEVEAIAEAEAKAA